MSNRTEHTQPANPSTKPSSREDSQLTLWGATRSPLRGVRFKSPIAVIATVDSPLRQTRKP